MKIIGNGILAERLKEEKKSKGGIILPKEEHKENDCIVLMVGSKVENVKVGDKISRVQFSGTPIDYMGKDCLILKEDRDVEFIY